jgi:hypothetical protein
VQYPVLCSSLFLCVYICSVYAVDYSRWTIGRALLRSSVDISHGWKGPAVGDDTSKVSKRLGNRTSL